MIMSITTFNSYQFGLSFTLILNITWRLFFIVLANTTAQSFWMIIWRFNIPFTFYWFVTSSKCLSIFDAKLYRRRGQWAIVSMWESPNKIEARTNHIVFCIAICMITIGSWHLAILSVKKSSRITGVPTNLMLICGRCLIHIFKISESTSRVEL